MYTMTDARWSELVSGIDCPFCQPRESNNEHWSKMADLNVSSLYLVANQTYKGYSVLVFNPRHVTRPSDLNEQEWVSFTLDLYRAQKAIESAVSPDHMNVAELGNQIAHLHWHIIPRYKNDPRWGAPVWQNTPEEMVKTVLSMAQRKELIQTIQERI